MQKYVLVRRGLFLFLGLLALFCLPSRSTVQQAGVTHARLAYAGQEPAKAWYFLHLDLGQAWQTIVTLTNREVQPVKVTLSAYDQHGGFFGKIPAITSLQAEATQTIEAKKVLPPASETIKLESTGHLVGSSIFETLDGTKAEAIPAIEDTSQQLDFPPLVQGDAADKTITLLNLDSTSANPLLIALDQAGGELGRTLLPPLLPMASHTFAVNDLFSTRSFPPLARRLFVADNPLGEADAGENPQHKPVTSLKAQRSFARGLEMPIAASSPATPHHVSLSGWFHIIWNDRPHYVLIDDQGRPTELLLDEDVTKPFGGPLAFNRKRVKIVAVPLANPPGAVQVLSIMLE